MSAEAAQHLGRSDELLEVARENLEHGHPADSVSRSYYAMFHAAKAVLAELGIERSSHHGVWAAFGQFVAREGLVAPEYHRHGLDAFSARIDSDYLAQPQDTAEDAEQALGTARQFVAACRRFLEQPRPGGRG